METRTDMPNKVPQPEEVILLLKQSEKRLDPFSLARSWGVQVVIGNWYPTTWGEYDRRSIQIYLNERAPWPLERILAHELGHFWIHQHGFQLSQAEEEAWVEAFAHTLHQSNTLCMTKA